MRLGVIMGMGRNCKASIEKAKMQRRNGFGAEVQASRKAWAHRDKAGAMAAISDDMLREIQLIGPAESCREQLQERAAQGAELQLIYAPRGDPANVAKQLEVLVR